MLAVYESIDLGIVSTLTKASNRPGASLLDLVQGNYPVFQSDPIHDDTLYVYQAFGVHVLNLRSLLKSLAAVLRDGNDSEAGSSSGLEASLETVKSTDVQPILLTFSVEQQCVRCFTCHNIRLTPLPSQMLISSHWRGGAK